MSGINDAFTTYDGYVIDHRAEAEVKRLTAEVARLRERLQQIADHDRGHDGYNGCDCEECGEMVAIAQVAIAKAERQGS